MQEERAQKIKEVQYIWDGCIYCLLSIIMVRIYVSVYIYAVDIYSAFYIYIVYLYHV